jgi:ABC-type Na+ efflux pump permease subunit
VKKIKLMERIGLALPKSPLAAIVWRELIDALRDRRTILVAIVLPIILIPIILNLPLFFISPKQNPPKIAVAQLDPYADNFTSLLESISDLKVSKISGSENLTRLVLENTYDIVVVIPANFTSLITANKTATLGVIYDSTNQRSSVGLAIIQTVQAQYANAIVKDRLSKLHVDPAILNPVKFEPVSVRAVTSSQAIAGYLIPYLIGLLSLMAGASFATDTTAGEKERRTLEVFLTQPVTRMKIILGKYLGVFMLSLIGIFCQAIAVTVGFNIYVSLYAEILGQTSQGLGLNTFNLLTISGLALILSMTGNAFLMVVSIFAKSFKEAQQYISAISLALTIPMILVMYLPPATLSQLIFVPFLGPVIIIRNAVFNIWAPDQLLICLASSTTYLLVFIYAALKVFSQEKVIFRV